MDFNEDRMQFLRSIQGGLSGLPEAKGSKQRGRGGSPTKPACCVCVCVCVCLCLCLSTQHSPDRARNTNATHTFHNVRDPVARRSPDPGARSLRVCTEGLARSGTECLALPCFFLLLACLLLLQGRLPPTKQASTAIDSTFAPARCHEQS